MTDGRPAETHFRFGRLIAIVTIAVAVLGSLTYGLIDFTGVFEPSHYVSITNDTHDTVNWSCSWSNLHVAPGGTGRIRVWNNPDRDFGCVSGAGTSHELDTCPPVYDMTAGKHFTVASWNTQFACP